MHKYFLNELIWKYTDSKKKFHLYTLSKKMNNFLNALLEISNENKFKAAAHLLLRILLQ